MTTTEKKITHTPGTWEISAGEVVSSGQAICVVPSRDRSPYWCEDFRLIAAAPDLLTVARAYVELASTEVIAGSELPGLPDMLAFARATVAKVEDGTISKAKGTNDEA